MRASPTRILAWTVVIAVLAGIGVYLYWMLSLDIGGTLSTNGIVAMVLGVVLSLVVGVGLMGLIFYSSRRGYDDRQRIDPE